MKTIVLMSLVLFGGCAAKDQVAGKPAIVRVEPGRVTHVVVCWLKTPGDEAGRDRLIAASRTFGEIPGVLAVTAGRAVPSTRPVVDGSFDVAVVIVFRDRASLVNYQTHPLHLRALEQTLKPLVARQIVYDVVE
jgi:hypothetical protein